VLDLLRRAHQSEVFRILLRDVQGDLSVRDVADELSQLAEAILTLAIPWVWQQLPNRHIRSEELGNHFCVIAYGKLGGRELGYGSDLDVVFLYEDADPNAQLHYIALVRKLITWLTVKTSEGQLYDIDTALRPNGNSGLLVTSIRAYETYQLQRGSNTAWTWELQAMTRARAVFGHSTLIHQFDAIRAQVLRTHRDEATLATEIQAMRNKLRQAHRVRADQFDIKHSPGGMVDAEFVVQFWVLAYSAIYPDLMENLGNIELIKIATVHNLVPAQIGQSAADAYQILREKQHQARLQDSKGLIPIEEANIEQPAIQALWDFVFEKKAQ
jgi:glutamate-ammonia-ligase adenylyltransferase